MTDELIAREVVEACASELGALGARLLAANLRRDAADPLSALLGAGADQPERVIEAVLGGDDVRLLIAVGVLERRGDRLHARVGLSIVQGPAGDVIVAHERRDRLGEPDAVPAPDRASTRILRASPVGARRWLDLGSGSGAIGIAAARGGATVMCADLNPRFPSFVALGASLSGVRVAAQVSDVMRDLPRETSDVITFAVPQLYDAGGPIASPGGPALIARFFNQLPEFLSHDPDAEVVLNVELPLEPLTATGRLEGLARPGDYRLIRIRFVEGDDFAMSLLWMSRRRGRAWWRDLERPATDAAPDISRAALEAMIEAGERG